MGKEYKWHDVVRKSFDSYKEAKHELEDWDNIFQIMKDHSYAALSSKLDSGSELVSGPKIEYVYLTEILHQPDNNAQLPAGKAFMEMKSTSILKDVAGRRS